jgi:hypothetical protein
MGYRNYSVANGFTVDPSGNGDFKTIAAALTASTSGTTIFIRPGTYTENLTLKAGVNLVAYISDGLTPNVTIVGKCTFTAAGTVSISGVRPQTNSDFFLAVTGSAASIVNLDYCYLNCSNNTGISFTTSSSSAKITIANSTGNIGTTGIALYSSSSAGTLTFSGCTFTNTGASTTASSCSAGVVNLDNITMASPISYSSASSGQIQQCQLDTSAQNATTLTTSNTANVNTTVSNYLSGSASAISIGSGSTVNGTALGINSSNTNSVTGSGTFFSSPPFFINSSGVNATTLSHYVFGITGTWTPNLQINNSSTGITYTTQVGGYTRIGNLVFVWMNIILSNKGASSGNVTISNLPFSTAGNGFNQILPLNYFTNWTSAGYTSMFILLANNSTVGTLASSGSGVGATAVTNTQITNTFQFQCNGFYIVD